MSILIAESGSTHTSWRLLAANGSVVQFQTEGINPYLENIKHIEGKLKTAFEQHLQHQTPSICYFYGAGCRAADNQERIINAIKPLLAYTTIEVEEDTLAAARAVCGHSEGICGILGTGSNACHYNGHKITWQPVSLGYLMGDEGSGNFLGKMLLKSYFEKELPMHLAQAFDKTYQLELDQFLEQIYQKEYPNRYLASYTHFLSQHKADPYVARMIYDAFQLYVQKCILKHPKAKELKIGFVGSIAFHFSTILTKVLKDNQLQTGVIAENAIAGLALYHKPTLS